MSIKRAAIVFGTLLLAACGNGTPQFQGYVEGDYVIVAAAEGGWVEKVAVTEGNTINPGDLLMSLEATRERAQRDAAAARLKEAEARLANISTGKRSEEIAVIDASIREASANLTLAESELQRQERLVSTGTGSRQRLDQTRATRASAAARLAELKQQREVALMPARNDELAAAAAAVEAAKAGLAEAEWRLSEREIRARVGGIVEDVLRETGEFVPPGGALVSLLPPENVKLRFFVPEARLAELKPGMPVAIACDGCPDGLTATISFIAPQAEFTPPVIYSVDQREKLVFLIEAKPAPGVTLRPGQPVDVSLAP